MVFPPSPRTADRRELIEKQLADPGAISGIDYLEVLDSDAPAGTPRQRTLLVTLFLPVPAGFSVANVRIEGGVRISDIPVAWAFGAARLEDASIPTDVVAAPEQAVLRSYLASKYPDAGTRAKQLIVRTGTGDHDFEGDLSSYSLRLVSGPGEDTALAGFDPKFSIIDFRFKVECPKDFDCGAVEPCPNDSAESPRINYLAKDYASFRRLMLDRMAVVSPLWTERRTADVGVMLVEAIAYAADHLSYFQDAVATEAYLGTARKRVSIRRHARLLDYAMHDGCNARAWLALTSEGGSGAILPTATMFCTRQTSAELTLEFADLEDGSSVFETLHPLTLHDANNRISIYPWGSTHWYLAQGATHATIEATGGVTLAPGDVLIFEELLGPDGHELTADPTRRHAVRLTAVAPPTLDPLTGVSVIELDWALADALPFALCVAMVANETALRDVTVARGNVVLVDAGYRVSQEPLPPPVTGVLYRPTLLQAGIACAETYSDSVARSVPASSMLVQDPRKASPLVTIADDKSIWTSARDLLGSGPFDTHFVVEIETDGSAQLRFGEGSNGKSPADGVSLMASYRVAGGQADNVGADAIAHAVRQPGFAVDFSTLKGVRNPLPAAGGAALESAEDARRYAPQAFRTQKRAVTEADYAEAAKSCPGVREAVARRRWTGSWYSVFVSVEREAGLPVDAEFARTVEAYLERYRMAGEDLVIEGPSYVPVDIAMEVCVAPGYFRSDVRAALLAAFSSGQLPTGQRGYFYADHFGFGDALYLSPIVARAMAVPGVAFVDLSDPARGHRFQRFGRPAAGEVAQGRIPIGRFEIVRTMSSGNFPEAGRIEFIMEGGL